MFLKIIPYFFFLKKFTFFYLFIYLFMTVLSLRFCARAFSSYGKWGPLFIAVRGPLTITASLVAEHRLQTRRLSSCGSRAQLLRGMWDLPRPGLKPVSPALAGRFSTTVPPGKPLPLFLFPSQRLSFGNLQSDGQETLAVCPEAPISFFELCEFTLPCWRTGGIQWPSPFLWTHPQVSSSWDRVGCACFQG